MTKVRTGVAIFYAANIIILDEAAGRALAYDECGFSKSLKSCRLERSQGKNTPLSLTDRVMACATRQ